jgi:RsiW-degrading membrane proteinase PrsW (M82 family)
MTSAEAAESLAVLVLAALSPALIYLAWVRRAEHYQGESWSTLLNAFAYGAIFATVTAAFLEALIVGLGTTISQRFPGPDFVFLNGNSTAGAFFLVLVVAPFIEEALKGSGVYSYRAKFRQVADGPVIGASVGLGFGFFETFLYGLGAFLVGGLVAGLSLIVLRSLSSVVLHGSTTGMFGYGMARSRFGRPGAGGGSYYLLAVGMHSAFNALASLTVILGLVGVGGVAVEAAAFVALLAAIGFAFAAIEHVRVVIQLSDYPSITGSQRYQPPAPRRPGVPPQR